MLNIYPLGLTPVLHSSINPSLLSLFVSWTHPSQIHLHFSILLTCLTFTPSDLMPILHSSIPPSLLSLWFKGPSIDHHRSMILLPFFLPSPLDYRTPILCPSIDLCVLSCFRSWTRPLWIQLLFPILSSTHPLILLFHLGCGYVHCRYILPSPLQYFSVPHLFQLDSTGF